MLENRFLFSNPLYSGRAVLYNEGDCPHRQIERRKDKALCLADQEMKPEKLWNLLQEMTLEEKIHQMLQLPNACYQQKNNLTGALEDGTLTREMIEQAGSVLSIYGAKEVRRIQEEYLKHQPHGIPLMFMLDVINGYQTVYPIPLAQGAMFDPALSKELAQMAAKEAAVSGVQVTFSPMVDLVRDARWGRVMESTGEDPYLNGLYAAAMVEGYQGNSLSDPYSVAACVKHFAGYGAPDAGRDYNTVELSDRTFEEYYLPAYRAGVDAGAAMVMTSFNTINGIPASGNRKLMRDVLRDEMGFDGILISDWAAIAEMIPHGYCADRKEAAQRALDAGVDIDMTTGIYSEQLAGLVRAGVVQESLIDEAVLRILTLKNELGLFEDPYKSLDEEAERQIHLCPEHRALARKAAEESFALLKNDGVLPLSKETSVAYIGPYVNNREMLGSWSFIASTDTVQTFEEAAKAWYGEGAAVRYCQGAPVLETGTPISGLGSQTLPEVTEADCDRWLREAVEAAKAADTVVLLLGEHRFQSGEAASRADITLPDVQMRLFEAVCAVNQNVAAVIFSGRPLDLRRVSQKAKAVLEVWMPGTEAASAILRTITGQCCPQGKLPMSFPYAVGQVPVHYNEFRTGRPLTPEVEADRFRSRYLDIPNEPLYPFGYGLSYTSFSYQPVTIDREEAQIAALKAGDALHVSVTVTNTGKVTGTETVQLYLCDVAASVVRPVKELKGFQKVTLAPGESQTVTFAVGFKELSFTMANGERGVEPGTFIAYAGGDSRTPNAVSFVCR